uniref:Bm401 n=1 Tax=Brugia malayi TaxID=6279 RepID=A0A1I9G1G4_BRUMA|nr:Bm401 [Brugia malayi]
MNTGIRHGDDDVVAKDQKLFSELEPLELNDYKKRKALGHSQTQ